MAVKRKVAPSLWMATLQIMGFLSVVNFKSVFTTAVLNAFKTMTHAVYEVKLLEPYMSDRC